MLHGVLEAQVLALPETDRRVLRAKISASLRSNPGRKRSNAPRCSCGEMTLKRAGSRGHKCAK
jgi:hypothetical protein